MFLIPVLRSTLENKRIAKSLNEAAALDKNMLLAELINLCGCHFNPLTLRAVFGLWAPHRKRRNLCLEILIPDRYRSHDNFQIYKRKLFELNRFQTAQKHCDFANDFYYLALNHIEPYIRPGRGILYRFCDPEEGTYVPDIYSYYQPWGSAGPSAIINQHNFPWKFESSLSRDNPVSIAKIHVGTASVEQTFNGLKNEVQHNDYFNHLDAVEFLPIGNFPGRNGVQLTYYKDFLVMGQVNTHKPLNWGYDGGPNFLVSVSESYGTPDELKDLIHQLHRKKIKVGFDLQLNHYGPENIYQDWYGPYISKESTEWGLKPNFAHPVIRSFLLQKIREFTDLYDVDFLRLDMSSRYNDDEFIRELCDEVGSLPVILEDERQKAWLTDPQGAGAVARWSFSTVHNLKAIRHQHLSGLETAVDKIINKSFHSVVYPTSHDEQGNHEAAPLQDKLTPALTTLTNGIEMSWYSFGYFHFFCNYTDPILLVKVTAEKCRSLNHYPENLWPLMKPLQAYFQNMLDCRAFFNFIHKLWNEEVLPHLKHDQGRALANIQTWINNNNNLVAICEAYNQTVFALANISKATVSNDFRNFEIKLKRLRQNNKWLYASDLSGNTFKYDTARQELTITRQNSTLNKKIILKAKVNESNSVELRETTADGS